MIPLPVSGKITQNMDLTTAIFIVVGSFVIIGIYIGKKLSDLSEKQKPSGELLEVIKMLQEGSKEDRKVLLDSLHSNTKTLNERLDAAARMIGQVQRNVGEMSEIGRGVKDLQKFLQNPQIRGSIGEQVLKDLITQVFPRHTFHLQYGFKSGEKVDAAIKTSAGILPIDSKFPMENIKKASEAKTKEERIKYSKLFKRDIKRHIKSIGKKYILPEEGTMDFALMYIPSEPVYYEMIRSPELLEFAQSSRVYPVSPTTLYAHLQTILLSFQGQEIKSKAARVFAILRAVQKDYQKVEENFSVLQRHLNNAYNMMGNVQTGFLQLGQKITSTQNLDSGEKTDKKEPKGS